MKVLVFAGSTSKQSINKQLATYASGLLDKEIRILDLNDFSLPLYSVDIEKEIDYPVEAEKFNQELDSADAFIVSLAEHNGSFAAGYKNLFDWLSRKQPKVFRNKPVLLLATSPGGRGGASVLGIAENLYPHLGAQVKGTFSLPNFYENFSNGEITNQELNEELKQIVKEFNDVL